MGALRASWGRPEGYSGSRGLYAVELLGEDSDLSDEGAAAA